MFEDNSCQWNRNKLQNVVPEPVVDMIMNVMTGEIDEEDRVRWCGENKGKFTVKSTYRLSTYDRGGSSDLDSLKKTLKVLWKLQIPSFLQLFRWKISRQAMPTCDILQKKTFKG
ncbi:hypothetical protein FRX31_020647, partial [Thalictrum thalictroides]